MAEIADHGICGQCSGQDTRRLSRFFGIFIELSILNGWTKSNRSASGIQLIRGRESVSVLFMSIYLLWRSRFPEYRTSQHFHVLGVTQIAVCDIVTYTETHYFSCYGRAIETWDRRYPDCWSECLSADMPSSTNLRTAGNWSFPGILLFLRRNRHVPLDRTPITQLDELNERGRHDSLCTELRCTWISGFPRHKLIGVSLISRVVVRIVSSICIFKKSSW
jgi:hypothetical protein